MTITTVLEALRNGDTASKIAERLGEPVTHGGRDCSSVVPALNKARAEGLVVRTTPNRGGAPCPVARWSFA